MYKVVLLIRRSVFKEGWRHPRIELLSKVILNGNLLGDGKVYLDIARGIGNSATISNTEQAFIKFLLHNYGIGRYSVQKAKGGFSNFWKGQLEYDRFLREGGSLYPYLKSETPRVWHQIKRF